MSPPNGAHSTQHTAAVKILSRAQLLTRLTQLRASLEALPNSLPDQVYHFDALTLLAESIEDRGRNGALNHLLECLFCPQGRANGPFLLTGRGPGLVSVVDVLSDFTVEFPEDAVLQKWIEDLISAAEHTSLTLRGSELKVGT